jgi:phosphate/sulfate permease
METYLIGLGFILASYSIIGNDAIQTLGTFLSSNSKKPWWILWAYASSILALVLIYGWYMYGGDVSYGRLNKIPIAETIKWWHIAPTIVLLLLTRLGIPVSTTFLVLSVFTPSLILGQIIIKSLVGYGVAFIAAIILWILISKKIEKSFINTTNNKRRWYVAQWITTGFLWSQWLIQDLANIYVYLPRKIEFSTLALTLITMISILGFIFKNQGGKIQQIVTKKYNTSDIRSATIIDGLYAVVLLLFKELNNLPMSTTWVFLGVLAGREYAMTHQLNLLSFKNTFKDTSMDLTKATLGLVISIIVALLIKEVAFSQDNINLNDSKKSRSVQTFKVSPVGQVYQNP